MRILLVDDEEDVRDFVGYMLQREGSEVCVAECAEQARASMRTFVPDVIISDIGMPGEDGCSLIRSIRALLHESRSTPAIAVTAFVSPRDRATALSAGFDAHIGKPLDQSELVAKILELVGPR